MKLNVLRMFSSASGGTIGQIRVSGQVPGCKVFARAKGERTPGRLCHVDEEVPDRLTLNPGYAWVGRWAGLRPCCAPAAMRAVVSALGAGRSARTGREGGAPCLRPEYPYPVSPPSDAPFPRTSP